MTLDATICPLCQSQNRCAVQQGETIELCWCSTQAFPAKAVIDDAKLANKLLDSRSCLCQACIKKLMLEAEMGFKRID